MSKVFGIGMHKTGTSSLGRALELLGYRSCMGANALRANLGEEKMMNSLFAGNYDEIFEFADNYSAFNDLPWCLLYKELDSHFPNSQLFLRSEMRKIGFRVVLNTLKTPVRFFGCGYMVCPTL